MCFSSEPHGNNKLFVDPVEKAILEGEKLIIAGRIVSVPELKIRRTLFVGLLQD